MSIIDGPTQGHRTCPAAQLSNANLLLATEAGAHAGGAVLVTRLCLATKIAERLDAESLLGSCVWSILEGEIAENGSAGQGSAKTIHSDANQQ
jgi:hypothetical protein